MIFYFNTDVYELSKEHNEMRRWLNINIGPEYEVRTWSFLRAYGSFSDPAPFNRIIFTNLEDAAMFKLAFGNLISHSKG